MPALPTLPSAGVLQVLADRAELTDLVARLGAWLDAGASGDPAALLVAGARVSTPGGQAVGIEKVADQARRSHVVPTQHVIANVLAEIDGDAARVSANLVVTFADSETELRRNGGTYAFDAVRTPAGWRFASITVRRVWREG
jgi:hypothetical protein